jgi:hypothetical protein
MLAKRKMRNNKGFIPYCNSIKPGDQKFIPIRKITPDKNAIIVVMINVVPRISILLYSDMNLINEISKPHLEIIVSRERAEIIAMAKPTDSGLYSLAAITQKKNPVIEGIILLRVINNEFS